MGAFASALLGFLPYLTSAAHAQVEIHKNSSNVQVVHNTPANTDVLNLSLNVEDDGDGGLDPCDSEKDDLLETGVHISVSRDTCATLSPTIDFDAQVDYVEHDIGSFSYGTSFGANAGGSVTSKIVALSTPPGTCGTWSINLQATGQNLSGITGNSVSLRINDSDGDGDGISLPECFDVNANVGNGITKPHHGVRR
jgi:hypothetical protein